MLTNLTLLHTKIFLKCERQTVSTIIAVMVMATHWFGMWRFILSLKFDSHFLANSAWQPPKPWRKYLFTMLLSSQVFLLQPMLTYFIIFRYFFIRSSSLCISIVILHFMSQINLSVNKTSLISGSVCTIKYLHLNGTAKFVIHPVCTVWREKHCSLSHKHINFN